MANETDWPSWINAISSVIALGIAIGLPTYFHVRQRNRERSTGRAAARATAILIAPTMIDVGRRLDGFDGLVDEYFKLPGDKRTRSRLSFLYLEEIDELFAYLDRFEVFEPPLSHGLISLVAIGNKYNATIKELLASEDDGGEGFRATMDGFRGYLGMLKDLHKKVTAVLRPIHDGEV